MYKKIGWKTINFLAYEYSIRFDQTPLVCFRVCVFGLVVVNAIFLNKYANFVLVMLMFIYICMYAHNVCSSLAKLFCTLKLKSGALFFSFIFFLTFFPHSMEKK